MNKIKDIEITKKQILKGKIGNPSYDFYKLKIIYSDNTRKTITVFTELNAIDINNHEQTKSFMINSLFGANGLIKEQGRDDYIFLGRPTKDANGKTIPYRFYKMENSNKNAQQYFDEFVYPRLKKIFSSNKQAQPISLYDEIKSPFDDINTIRKIVELYANLEMNDYEMLYRKIVKNESENENNFNKHLAKFTEYILFPTLFELYNNIIKRKDDILLEDDRVKKVFSKFNNFEEFSNYLNTNHCYEMYKNFISTPQGHLRPYKSINEFIKYHLGDNSDLSDEQVEYNLVVGAIYDNLMNRFNGATKDEFTMGFHVNPQNLKSSKLPADYEMYTDGMKYYINAGYDTYRFAKYFQDKCIQNNLNYYFKVVNPLKNNEHYRSDKLCIYTSFKNAEVYLQLIEEVMKEHPDIKYRKPPIVTGTIQNYIGVGIDRVGEGSSYNNMMSKICFNVINKYFKDKEKKEIINYINSNHDFLYTIRENIIRQARELGLSEKICLSEDAVLQLTNNKSKRR